MFFFFGNESDHVSMFTGLSIYSRAMFLVNLLTKIIIL